MKNEINNQLSKEQLNEVRSLINENGIIVPQKLNTIDLQDIYHALQYEEISSKLSNVGGTIDISSVQGADKIKHFILSFNNSSFKPESIIVVESLVFRNIPELGLTI